MMMKNSSMINGSVDGGGGNDDDPSPRPPLPLPLLVGVRDVEAMAMGSSVCERRRERQNLLTQGMAVVVVYKEEMTVVVVYTIN